MIIELHHGDPRLGLCGGYRLKRAARKTSRRSFEERIIRRIRDHVILRGNLLVFLTTKEFLSSLVQMRIYLDKEASENFVKGKIPFSSQKLCQLVGAT